MTSPLSRAVRFLSQIFFTSAVIAMFTWPRVVTSSPIRRLLGFLFGRLLAPRYADIIEFYGPDYGAPLATALDRAATLCGGAITRVVDCGTGTGFAARAAVARFPAATVVAVDMTDAMLDAARQAAATAQLRVRSVLADNMHLPFADATMDLVIAQNTLPVLPEFARVCRPGGVVVFVDVAAPWASDPVRAAALRTGHFDLAVAERAALGFYLVARRTASAASAPVA